MDGIPIRDSRTALVRLLNVVSDRLDMMLGGEGYVVSLEYLGLGFVCACVCVWDGNPEMFVGSEAVAIGNDC